VHAYLHRKEGDSWNAAYWYQRAGKSQCRGSLQEERAAIAEALLRLPGPLSGIPRVRPLFNFGHLNIPEVEAVQMSSHEVGPEWVLSSFTSSSPAIQDQINELVVVSRRLWPRIQTHAIKEQPQRDADEAIAFASDVWESALQSVAKTIVRSNGRGEPIRDFDAYLFGIFIHRFNRALRKERKRREMFRHFPSAKDLEVLRQAHDSKTAREIEQSVQIREAIQSMDEWTRKVWIARKYGYSWHEIAVFFDMTDPQAKLKFRSAISRLREKLGL
jgi:DNA-directed RNA polymerase specialized sigma24 family protein